MWKVATKAIFMARVKRDEKAFSNEEFQGRGFLSMQIKGGFMMNRRK